MEDNNLWALVWKCCAAVVCVGIVSLSSCVAYESHLVAKSVEAGVNPIAARCGMGMIESMNKSIPCYEAAKK